MSFDFFRNLRTQSAAEFFSDENLNINAVGEYGRSLLHEAIACRKADVAKTLIAKDVLLNLQDSKAQTALHYAAVYSMFETAKLIVEKGGDLNISDEYGNDPLWTSALAAKGDYRLVGFLIANGANPKHKNNVDKSVLDFAKQSNNLELWTVCGGSKNEF